ncbi:MAG: hypothetical protein AAGA54_27260 [Myxococcota bacterium]
MKPEPAEAEVPLEPGTPNREAAPTVEGGALAKSTFKPPAKDEALAAKAELSSQLSKGRKAVKAKNYAEGIDALRAAKALAPMNAKVLGELGWALFLDGQLDDAEHELQAALHVAVKSVRKGAILYNLGRVEEARRETTRAADRYRQSLAVRPNETVKARLESLGVDDAATHSVCTIDKEPGRPPLDLCADVLRRAPESGREDPPTCEFGWTKPLREGPEVAASAAGERRQASVFKVEEPTYAATAFSIWDRDIMEESFYLGIVVGDAWYVASLATVMHPGVGYADESVGLLELEAKELTGDGAKELIVRWSVGAHDMDPGVMYMEDTRHENTAVLSLDGGAPRWVGAVRTFTEWNSGEMDPDEWGGLIDPKTGTTTADLTFDGAGKLTITATGTPPPSTPVGTFSLGAYPVLCPDEQDHFGL